MINCFDVEIAQDVGMAAAVLYYNIRYWCLKNKANGDHFHDGLYWTYNSMKAFRKLFPYMSEREVRTALKKLEEKGYVKTGNFNTDGRDRTRWYADLLPNKNNNEVSEVTDCKCQNDIMQVSKCHEASDDMIEPLPDINIQITTANNKNERMNESSKGKPARENTRASFKDILESYPIVKDNPDLMDAFWEFIKHRERKKRPLTDYALELSINKAIKHGNGDPQKIIERINECIEHGWDTIYAEKVPTAPQARRAPAQGVNPYTELKKKFLEEGHL